MLQAPYDAVLVVSFGGPEGPEEVRPFLERVVRGRAVPAERLEEVATHYLRFGGVSPINAQVRAFLGSLSPALEQRGVGLPLYWGNRNWHPLLEDTMATMAGDGVRRAVAYVTSAFSSAPGCRQYLDDIERARAAVGPGAPVVDKLVPFFDRPGFVEAVAEGAGRALAELPPGTRDAAELVFTAHSIPLSLASSCDYEAQIAETARLVVERLGARLAWAVAYQSRSGPPSQPWLGPDVLEHLAVLAARSRAAVVVPVGFVSDHMEVAFDLDVEARETADEVGLPMARSATAGTHPAFVGTIADLVAEKVTGVAAPRGLSRLAPRPDPCLPGCCPAAGVRRA
ncbi:MAG: ferrochelatase [Acidimicrobiales bacterium]